MSSSRRGQGDGSVFPIDGGRRWRAQVFKGYGPTGARLYRTKTARTQADAKRLLRDMLREAHTGDTTTLSRAATVKSWSAEWLTQRSRELRPKPYETLAGHVVRWIIPTIGGRRLDQVTPSDLRAVGRAVTAAGRSDTTAHHVQAAARQMLKAARAEGYPVPTRVLEVSSPAMGSSDRDAIPLPDVAAILRAATVLPHATRWTGAFFQGIRQGEACGLTWSCVDLDAGLIDVSWQLQELRLMDRDRPTLGYRVPAGFEMRHLTGGHHLVRPKTTRGRRLVPMIPAYVEQLAAWRAASPDNPWGLVWPHRDDRPGRGNPLPRSGAVDRREWYALQDAAQVAHVDGAIGRRYTVHEVRHTTATALLAAGVDPHVVTAILGHSTITTSRGYQHVSQTMAREAMAAVAAHLQIEP